MWEFIENLYDDVGAKIKKIVKISFMIEIIFTIVMVCLYELILLIQLSQSSNGTILFTMMFVPVGGVLMLISFWISSLITYNLGEISDRLVNIDNKIVRDNTHRSSNNNMQDLSNTKLNGILNAPSAPSAASAPVAPAKVENGVWFCGYCGAKNLEGRTTCWSCDKPKG